MTDAEITCEELHEKLTQGEEIRLIDCREPWEYERVRLEGAELIPMNETPARLATFEACEKPQIVYCHHGMRSLRVVEWLRSQGVEDVLSLRGGIDRWSLEIDASLPRY